MRLRLCLVSAFALTSAAHAQDVLSYTTQLEFSNWPVATQLAYVTGQTDGVGATQFYGLDGPLQQELRRCLVSKGITGEQIRRTVVSIIDAAPETQNEPASRAVAAALARICGVQLPRQ